MIIGLGHQKRVGKDTVADFLVEYHNFTKVSFAAPLKELAEICGFPPERDLKIANWAGKYGLDMDGGVFRVLLEGDFPHYWRELDVDGKQRKFLQWLGTDLFRRWAGANFWVRAFDRQYGCGCTENLVVTDVRFPEEFRYLSEERGAYMVKVVRPGLYPNYHLSETALEDVIWPSKIKNRGDLTDLRDTVEMMMKDIYEREERNANV